MRATPLGVRQPTPSPTTASEAGSGPGSASAGEPLLSDPLDADTSIPSASNLGPDAKPLKVNKKPIADIFRGLFLAGAAQLHGLLARTDWERDAAVWLATEAEAAGVADPLAAIAGRRTGGALIEPDMGDLINAGIAFGGYLARNISTAARIRIATRRAAAHGVHPNPVDIDGDQETAP